MENINYSLFKQNSVSLDQISHLVKFGIWPKCDLGCVFMNHNYKVQRAIEDFLQIERLYLYFNVVGYHHTNLLSSSLFPIVSVLNAESYLHTGWLNLILISFLANPTSLKRYQPHKGTHFGTSDCVLWQFVII